MQVVLMFVVLTMKVIRITSPASSVGEVSAVTAPRPPLPTVSLSAVSAPAVDHGPKLLNGKFEE